MSSNKTFKEDRAFLEKHQEILVLESDNSKIIVCPSLQGRVFTSTADGDDGFSFGWINYDLISSGKILKHCNNWGGEDRFWMGPEGGQFSIFFPKGTDFSMADWQTPAPIDTESWSLIASEKQKASFSKSMVLPNTSGNSLKVKADRTVILLDDRQVRSALGIDLENKVKYVGFKSINKLTNENDFTWNKETGMLSIWILGQLISTESNTVILPYDNSGSGPLLNDTYFGKIDANRLKILDHAFLFKGDGKKRGKIGIGPARTKPLIGSYDEENGILTIVKFSFDKSKKDYVNSMWEQQNEPFKGDVVNSYNDGPLEDGSQMGPFYELETSSFAANLKPGETITHEHSTFHFQGEKSDLEKLSIQLLGIGFDDCF